MPLTIDKAVPRFQTNETRFDTFVNGGVSATWTTSGGSVQPSITKFLADRASYVDGLAASTLSASTAAKNAAEAARDEAVEAAETATSAAALFDPDGLLAQAEAARDAAIAARDVALAGSPYRLPTFAALSRLTYGTATGDQIRVAEGDVVDVPGVVAYQVAASGATDQHVTTAGGVKLYALPYHASPDRDVSGEKPWLNISATGIAPPKNHVFIRQDTSVRGDAVAVQIQRVVTTDDGHTNPKALRALTNITGGGGDQIEWAISGEVENSDNTRVGAAEGGCAVSGVALKKAANTGAMFGGHFQVKDETGAATVGGIVGIEVNIQGNGADTNSNRVGLDIISRTFGAGTSGVFHAGVRIRNSGGISGGRWTNALLIEDGAQTVINGITINTSPGASGVGIQDSGSKAIGLMLAGSYMGAAIQVGSSQYIAMETSNTIKTAWGITTSVWGFYNGASERIGFNMTASPQVRVAGLAVLGQRRTGWSAASGTATRTTYATSTVTLQQLAERVKALTDDLLAHGLIGA